MPRLSSLGILVQMLADPERDDRYVYTQQNDALKMAVQGAVKGTAVTCIQVKLVRQTDDPRRTRSLPQKAALRRKTAYLKGSHTGKFRLINFMPCDYLLSQWIQSADHYPIYFKIPIRENCHVIFLSTRY